MNFLNQALSFIFTAANWGGPAGLAARIGEHLQYTVIAVIFSALIAIPIGMIIGHTGRGTLSSRVSTRCARCRRCVLLLGVLLWGLGLVPPTVALMLLGIPPLLAGTYSGIANVDPAVVDAARSMGMTERRVLLRVEVPNAMPLILGGLRTATLQIVATATVAAYASLGGLGRYLIDGIKVREFYLALVGALMVTALALILDAALAFAVWASVPGTGRLRKMPQPLLGDEVALESGAGAGTTDEKHFLSGLRTRGSFAYGRWVSAEQPAAWPAILTWRAHDVPRMESVRVQLSGNRIKAYGRIVAAATATHPAFSASYDLVTDESGATKRLSMTVTLAERERQLSIARDEENMWLVQDHSGQSNRSAYEGALDVDVVFSPFFNTLPIRRTGLYQGTESVALPVVYVTLPDLAVNPATISYSSASDGIKLHSPVADTTVTVDSDGFILDYPGLAERI